MRAITSRSALRLFAATCVLAILDHTVALGAELKVLKTGVGSGRVTSAPVGIDCGATCTATFGSVMVTLTATADSGSTFAGWDQDVTPDTTTTADCRDTTTPPSNTCTVSLAAARSVRPKFDVAVNSLTSFTPEAIATYLSAPANAHVNTPARFLKALPSEYKQNWILMSRSESLQTGTAASPRILLPSADGKQVFSIGMTTHSSYPGAHPNAIEYMQWDAATKNFRFHEIVLAPIMAMGSVPPRSRGVSIDDARCFQCHSTRNVLNRSAYPGTTGVTPGTVKFKSKPNWDSYDSWGGMLPFNRDRIYQGSVEAAAFRKIFDPWTWRNNESIRSIIEQLHLQPPGVVASDAIVRLRGGANDGRIKFAFDPATPPTIEPAPSSSGAGLEAPIDTAYSFEAQHGSGAATHVTRGGAFVTMRHTTDATSDVNVVGVGGIEGRGVQFFDILGGFDGEVIGGTRKPLNVQRVVDELVTHRHATGSVPVDVRPIALAIAKLDTDGQPCLRISGSDVTTRDPGSYAVSTPILDFLRARHGGSTIAQVVADTATRWSAASPATLETRTRSMPRRKADIQRFNLDRTNDLYLFAPENGLFQEYGAATTINPTDTMLDRLRREVFRRPNDLGAPDGTVMNDNSMPPRGFYVDRESYGYNTNRMALFRYFLEPLGVSVDKWSMNVRGRSRAYAFADIFSTYIGVFELDLADSLASEPVAGLTPPFSCASLVNAINTILAPFPARVDEVPTFTDVQRIFNKACIECHGGLGYPPYGPGYLDFSEDEAPPATTPAMPSARLARSHAIALSRVTTDPATSRIYRKITETSEACSTSAIGLMPCGGPPLSKVDIETIRRWIVGSPSGGSAPFTVGDPHLRTVDGVNYDFQSAGEFVLLRNESLEIQTRQTAIATSGPLGANAHTGLVSCASLNTAVAVRVGSHRISYQPTLNGRPSPEGLELRVDGKLMRMNAQGILLPSGGRIVATSARAGIQIEAPGGAVIVVTPAFWDHYQVWYLNVDARQTRATQGIMGAIAPGSWLPALPDGTSLGVMPRDLHQRYVDLYERFEDAWRVSGATSLFDYAPGTSTQSFTIRDWPAENPKQCDVPVAVPGGPIAREPLQAMSIEVARQHCAGLTDADRRAHCEQDVMVTGEPQFAKTYLASERIVLNRAPTAPVLKFPEDNAIVSGAIRFTWNAASDADGHGVKYRHCVWPAAERPNFAQCDLTPIGASVLPVKIKWSLLLLIVVALLLILWLLAQRKRTPVVVALIAFIVLIGALYVYGLRSMTGAKSVPALRAGVTYDWRVFAEDELGGVTESETRRFTVEN